jgi:hypothetical protein
MTTALHSLAPLDGIPVRVSADFVGLDDGTTQLVVSGNIDVTKLPFVRLPDRRQATVESVAVAFDGRATSVATLPTERTAMDLRGCRLRARGAGRHPLPEGRDAQARALSGPLRRRARTARLSSAAPGSGSRFPSSCPAASRSAAFSCCTRRKPSRAPVAAGHDVPTSRTRRRCAATPEGESLYAQIYAYNPKLGADGAAKLFAQAEILKKGVNARQGRSRADGVGRPKAPPCPHTSRIKLLALRAGDYELRMTVSDENANSMASRRVAFTVVRATSASQSPS